MAGLKITTPIGHTTDRENRRYPLGTNEIALWVSISKCTVSAGGRGGTS
jgi:hypothetical protein